MGLKMVLLEVYVALCLFWNTFRVSEVLRNNILFGLDQRRLYYYLVWRFAFLCFALLVIFKAWKLPAKRGIETLCRSILCVSLLYRIGETITRRAKQG